MAELRLRFLWWGAAVLVAGSALAAGADWPEWGGRPQRNMVSDEPARRDFFPAPAPKDDKKGLLGSPPSNVRWIVKLGSQTYSTPAVAGGRVFIGTNDGGLDDPRLKKTGGGLLVCLDEATGKRLWQLPIPRLATKNADFNFDHMNLGLLSSPTVDGDRVYVVTNRAEVLCLDVQGQANGNDGPFKDEGSFMAGAGELPDKPGRFDRKKLPPAPTPVPVQPTDGDILWAYDMLSELDVWPQDAADCSVLVHGDYVYVCTSNGVDRSHRNVPSPEAPDLIVLDKKTGRLVAVNHPAIGKAIFHGEWSSPSLGVVGGKTLIFFGGGDGVCYAFDAQPPASTGTKPAALTKVWSFDCNPPENKFKDGKPIPYNRGKGGPSEIMATPVFRDGRVYVAVGQDSNHGPGHGCLSCIDASKKGDITQTGKVWQCTKVQRAFSTASVAGNLVFQADFTGFVHCLDAATGSVHWSRDVGAHVYASTLVADGKVYVADETGTLTILAAAKEEKVLGEIRFGEPIFATPVIANGVLYVATKGHLVALQGQ